jgi:hypothetical protein
MYSRIRRDDNDLGPAAENPIDTPTANQQVASAGRLFGAFFKLRQPERIGFHLCILVWLFPRQQSESSSLFQTVVEISHLTTLFAVDFELPALFFFQQISKYIE